MDPTYPRDLPVDPIFCRPEALSALTEQELMYAYHLSQACLRGQPICIFQKSFESPALHVVLLRLFMSRPRAELHQLCLDSGCS
jgi:dipeptidyl-peptidase-3